MKIKPLHPLISCICITDNRPSFLLKSILYFDQQNYPNTELVISYPESDEGTRSIIAQLNALTDIRILAVVRNNEISLGEARNQAVNRCNGAFVCMWDDDDIFFFTRIADQYNLLQGNGRYFQASVIPVITLFDASKECSYVSKSRYWNGTLLCKKQHFLNNPCRHTDHEECTPVIEFLVQQQLLMTSGLDRQLYVHIIHDTNQTNQHEFRSPIDSTQSVPRAESEYYASCYHQTLKLNVQ